MHPCPHLPSAWSLHFYSCIMDGEDGLREDSSPSVSSATSTTSLDLSADLASVSSDQVLTPVTASCGCKAFEEQSSKASSVKLSTEVRSREIVWRETSFLGDDE